MDIKYVINEKIGIIYNENEVCFFSANDGKGSVLRGIGVELFRLIHKNINKTYFYQKQIYDLDSSLDKDTWDSFFEILINKKIIIRENELEENKVKTNKITIGLLGGSSILEKALKSLQLLDFCDFIVEKDNELSNNPSSNINLRIVEKFLPSIVKECDLVVLLDDSSNIDLIRKWNSVTSNIGVPFLNVRIYNDSFEIGPLVLPGQCACFECYWKRIQSGDTKGEIPDWFFERKNTTNYLPYTFEKKLTLNVAIQYLTLECRKFSQGNSVPLSIGHVISQDLSKGKMRIIPLLEVPGCKVCKNAGRIESDEL